MRKQPADADDDFDADAFTARFEHMADIALASAMEAKGAALSDDEAESILGLCAFYILALANGLSPQACADMARTETRGTYTVH